MDCFVKKSPILGLHVMIVDGMFEYENIVQGSVYLDGYYEDCIVVNSYTYWSEYFDYVVLHEEGHYEKGHLHSLVGMSKEEVSIYNNSDEYIKNECEADGYAIRHGIDKLVVLKLLLSYEECFGINKELSLRMSNIRDLISKG